MYYQSLKELIEELGRKVESQELKSLFLEKYGSGSTINMNKALRKLRENKRVRFKFAKKDKRKIIYWAVK